MAATDLFLRSKDKLRATDLWLHPEGADGSTPPFVSDSGTVVAVVVPTSAEALADARTLALVAALAGGEAVAAAGVATVAVAVAGEHSIPRPFRGGGRDIAGVGRRTGWGNVRRAWDR